MNHQEISDELVISKKTIENHISKALKIIRSGLEKGKLINAN